MRWPAHTSEVVAWIVAAAWAWKLFEAARGLPQVPDLVAPEHDRWPEQNLHLTVIVPACNEEANVGACLQSLLAQDYPNLRILAVDDRSTDRTASVIANLASTNPSRLELLRITSLPPLWLGKTHAMHVAAQIAIEQHQPDFLLFTDADIIFRADALRRSLAQAEATQADHFVTAPTALMRRWDEGMLLGVFQVLGMWGVRSWKVSDAEARDAVGVGAFNMLRTSAYLKVGGFESLRMQVVEDIGLGRRVKRLGLRQRIAFGRGLVNVHWAKGVSGLVGVMTKNTFAIFHYRPALVLFAILFLRYFCIGPAVSLFYTPTRLPGVIGLTCIALLYRMLRSRSAVPARYALLFPLGSAVFIYTLVLSMAKTWIQGGVRWRGTLYPLKDLRENSEPL